jgi:hypothetical protein
VRPEVDSYYSCTTLRYVVDAKRDVTLPVGVVIWNQQEKWLRFRLPKEGERIDGVAIATAAPYLDVARSQIEGWLHHGKLPYAREALRPLSDAWWDQVRRLLQWRIRVGPVQPIDCRQPEEEIEALYEALVQPHAPARERVRRIDGAVGRALGQTLAVRLHRGTVPGFHNRPVSVLRLTADERHAVIVEAVNLAAATAERDSDALTSRLLRIKKSGALQEFRFVLGYIASPGGLNGEAALKEWIEEEVGVPLYDLDREQADFRAAAQKAIADLDDPMGLYRTTESTAVSA